MDYTVHNLYVMFILRKHHVNDICIVNECCVSPKFKLKKTMQVILL